MMKRLSVVLFLLLCAHNAGAQDTTAVRDTAAKRFPPGKALMRSLLVPGWGQFSVGAYTRGAFFAFAQGSSYYMLVRTDARLDEARDRMNARRGEARDSILLTGDTANLELRIDTTAAVVAAEGLVRSRERHMEDWIAYAIFFTLASGVDAFVAAHLADFPPKVGVEPEPDGGVRLRLSVPLPSRRQR